MTTQRHCRSCRKIINRVPRTLVGLPMRHAADYSAWISYITGGAPCDADPTGEHVPEVEDAAVVHG